MQKAVTMYSSSEEDEREGAASASKENNEQVVQGGGKQQGTLTSRRLSAESQDFEFNKLAGGQTSAHMIGQLHEAGVQLASADELFYKGQLLPLQYNTRAPYINSVTSSPISPCPHDNMSTIETPSSKLSLSSLSRDQDVKFSSSCRMDHVGLDSSLFDFTRSSSFRSHSTNYSSYYCNYYANYGPSCTGLCDHSSTTTSCGGESGSSSRDSTGSSQDSCSSSDHNRDACCHAAAGHAFAAGVNGPFTTCPKRKPGFMQSWKILFYGFRRGSHSTAAACRAGDHQTHNPISSSHGSLSRAAAAKPSPNSCAAAAACGCKVLKDQKSCNNDQRPRSPSSNARRAHEKEKGRINASQISSDHHNQSTPKGSRKLEKDTNMKGSSAKVGSRWQVYTRRIKPISIIKARLVGGHANYDDYIIAAGSDKRDEDQQGQVYCGGEQGWLNKGRDTRPTIERRFSQPSLERVAGVKGGAAKVVGAFRFHAVSSSCPASVRSSPNHSGLLVASPGSTITHNLNTNMSTMQELHSAVQGAIAHCKQSISSIPPPSSSPTSFL